jgi:hypothetical protein
MGKIYKSFANLQKDLQKRFCKKANFAKRFANLRNRFCELLMLFSSVEWTRPQLKACRNWGKFTRVWRICKKDFANMQKDLQI